MRLESFALFGARISGKCANCGAPKVAAWGLATWDGLRAPPEHPEHLSIAATLDAARDVAGDGHHFRAVQLPFNLAMAEGFDLVAMGRPLLRQPDLVNRLPERELADVIAAVRTGSAVGIRRAIGARKADIRAQFPQVFG